MPAVLKEVPVVLELERNKVSEVRVLVRAAVLPAVSPVRLFLTSFMFITFLL